MGRTTDGRRKNWQMMKQTYTIRNVGGLGAALVICLVACDAILMSRAGANPHRAERSPDAPVLPSLAAKAPTSSRSHLAMQPYKWANVAIVGGGFVTGIIPSPTKRGLVYARTDIGGAYRWQGDEGRWTPIEDWINLKDWTLYGAESVATDPSDPNRVYVQAGMYTNNWSGNGAFLRSDDQGATFERTPLPFKMGGNEDGRSIGERVAVDPSDGSILFMGTRHNGLWKSVDRGVNWHAVDSFPEVDPQNRVGVGWVVFEPHSATPGKPSQRLFAMTGDADHCLYRSFDGGDSWKAVSLPAGLQHGLIPHHGVLGVEGVMYLSFSNGPGPNGVSDGAVWSWNTRTDSWTDITPLRPGDGDSFGYAGLDVDKQQPGTIVVSTIDRWGKKDTVFRSVDGGKHWVSLKEDAIMDSSLSPFLRWGRDHTDFGHWIGDVKIDPFDSDHAWYVTGATIWTTHDLTAADRGLPTHWKVGALGLEETADICMVSPPEGAHLLTGLGDIGGFRHDDLTVAPASGMFTNPLLSNTDSIDFAGDQPNVIVRVGRGQPGQSGGISTDGGRTWRPFASEPHGVGGSGSIAIARDGQTIVWAPERTTPNVSFDLGATWTECVGAPHGSTVFADPVHAGVFYAFSARDSSLYRSQNSGREFQAQNTHLPAGAHVMRATPGLAGDLWLACESGLYRSTDAGVSFNRIEGVNSANSVGFGKAAPGRQYPSVFLIGTVGGSPGVFRSDDIGAQWVQLNDSAHGFGTMNNVIGDPRIYGRVYVGTNGRGVLYGDPP